MERQTVKTDKTLLVTYFLNNTQSLALMTLNKHESYEKCEKIQAATNPLLKNPSFHNCKKEVLSEHIMERGQNASNKYIFFSFVQSYLPLNNNRTLPNKH